ncbi:MAG: chorismate-binding protein, partial [Muribaculaceae bacterium]
MLDNQLHTAINHCIAHHIPFAAYRFPGCEPVFMADNGCSPLIDDKLFVINRWNTGSNANITLRNRLSAEAVLRLGEQSATDDELPAATDREQYLSRVESLIEELKTTGGKTVIARTATGTLPQSPANCFAALTEAMPLNFCHIYYTPATGAWMGATPEVLLDAFDRKYITMALAGTRPADSCGPWDEKNTREQQMVTDFIVDNLRPLSAQIEVSNKITLPSGKIEHICTRIKGSLLPEVSVN